MGLENTYFRGNMPQLELFNPNKTMEFIIGQKSLLTALAMCIKAVKSNPVFPIQECFKISLAEEKCKITGTCNEIFIVTSFPAEHKGVFDVCVNAKKFIDYIKTLVDQPLSFEVNQTENTVLLNLKTLSGEAQFPADVGDEFPATPLMESNKIEIESKALNSAIHKSVFACSNDSSKSTSSALIEFGNGITVVGADGIVISVHKCFENTINRYDALVKPFILNTLLSLDLKGLVSLSYSDRNICFDYENASVYAILSEGKYPDYKSIIPPVKERPITVALNVKELKTAIDRVLIFANSNLLQCIFTFEENKLTIQSSDNSMNRKGVEVIDCIYDQEKLVIGLIGTQIIDIITRLETSEAIFYMADDRKQIMIKGDDSDENVFINVPSVIQ